MEDNKLKNYEVFNLQEGLNKLTGITGFKFNYAILKNSKALEAEIKLIQEALKEAVSEPMQEIVGKVEGKRVDLDKDETAELTDFLTADEIATYQEYNVVIEGVMNQDSDFDIYKIDEKYIPEDLTLEQTAVVMELIKE